MTDPRGLVDNWHCWS